MHNLNKNNFFFIVGRPRSGTTLLLTLLDANPHVLIPVEWPVIMKLLPKYKNISHFSPEMLKEFYQDVENTSFHHHYSYYDMNFDFDTIKKEILSSKPETSFPELISCIYTHYKSIFEKQEIKALGDKNPLASKQVNQLLKYFPDAKFIHLVRDYRDHTVSMLKAGFGSGSIPLIVYRWKKYQLILEKAYLSQPHRFFRLRYEDLVNEPEVYLKQICEFLNLPYYPEMLNYHNANLNELYPKNLSEQYQTSLSQPVNTGRQGIWKNKFSKKQIRIMDYMAGKTAEKWNYKRQYNSFSLYGLFFKVFFGLRGFLKR